MEQSKDKIKNERYIKEIMSLNLLCQIFNSKEFKNLFGKSQLYSVIEPKTPQDVEKGMKLQEMIELIKQKNKIIKQKTKKKKGKKLTIDDIEPTQEIQELISYFGTDLSQEILEELSINYLNKMYENGQLTNRGIHSIIVGVTNALIAKRARLAKQDILLAFSMGFVHDLGHTPLGHDLEFLIDKLVKKETGLNFSHEQNGLTKFDDLTRNSEQEYYERLVNALEREGISDYDEEAIATEYSSILLKVRDSILVHSIKRMPKDQFEKMKRYKFVNKWLLSLSRISDKIAYTTSDIRDVHTSDPIARDGLRKEAKRHIGSLINKYAQRHNIQIDPQEMKDMFNEYSNLSLGEQAIYLVRKTHITEEGLYMNPFVWRMAKGYRKALEEYRQKEEGNTFNKNIKAKLAAGYIVWESIFLKNYKMEKELKANNVNLIDIIDRTTEMVSQLTDRDLITYSSNILADIRTDDKKDGVTSIKDSLEQKYLEGK